jgi:hypothetical protein
MIFSLLFLSLAEACVGPALADRNYELKYDYKYENRENPTMGMGIGISNVYHKSLVSCQDAVDRMYTLFKKNEINGFHLAHIKLSCRDLERNYDYVILEK